MAALYIHIPFCHKACTYCNFHFSTSLQSKNELIEQLCKEIVYRKDYLSGQALQSIYFGGGTPSLLSMQDLHQILETIHHHFVLMPEAEITLEANPDDLHRDKLRDLQSAGINRLSLGIQSFFDEDLLYMNRSHNAAQALQCLHDIAATGFDSFSADLIFGYPLLSDDKWQSNIQTLLDARAPHISGYAMTVEPKTALAAFIKKKQEPPIDSSQAARQFETLMSQLENAGYEHYEISNYALPKKRAIHNSSYWKGEPYLGIGPSAHSFDGESRQWNVANNALYIRSLLAGQIPYEKEMLSDSEKCNEQIMIRLRTIEGLDTQIVKNFLSENDYQQWSKIRDRLLQEDYLYVHQSQLFLSRKGKLFADYVAAELFV